MILPLEIYDYYTTFCKEKAMFCEDLLTASTDKSFSFFGRERKQNKIHRLSTGNTEDIH